MGHDQVDYPLHPRNLMAVLTLSKQAIWPHSSLPNPQPLKARLSGISAEPLGEAESKTLFFHWRT